MKITLEEQDGLKFVHIGWVPDIYDDKDWDDSIKLLISIFAIIRNNYKIDSNNNKQSFIYNSEEFAWYHDDLMPIGIYAKTVNGNDFIEKLATLLKSEFHGSNLDKVFFDNIWNDISNKLNFKKSESKKTLAYLKQQYSSPDRFYHDISHISQMLVKISNLKDSFKYINNVLIAAFFHDVIYSISRDKLDSSNEEQSAIIASEHLKRLGLDHSYIDKISFMIKATQFHKSTKDNDTDLFLDIDMSIIASPKQEYEKYCKSVMKEYTQKVFTKNEYQKGRLELFLNPLLESKNIFLTKQFESLENIARKNIQNEIDLLKKQVN